MRKDRYDEAKKALSRTARPGFYSERELNAYVTFIKHTNVLEKAEAAKGSLLECFKGSNLRRTEIVSTARIFLLARCLAGPPVDVRCMAGSGLGRPGYHPVHRRLVRSRPSAL